LHLSKIVFAFLELSCTEGYEVNSGDGSIEFGSQECGFCEVEGEEWFYPVCHIIWAVSGRSTSSDTIGPEHIGDIFHPVGQVGFGDPDQGLPDGAMRSFNDT
jgi:hypothetical protein